MFAALFIASASAAAFHAGDLDTTFGVNGYSLVPLGTRAVGAAVAVQPSGRIVTAGQATIDGTNVIISTGMTAGGHLDPSYGVGGVTIVNPGTGAGVDSGAALAVEPNGDLVIAGTARSAHGFGPLSFAAVRLLPDGILDPSFGDEGIATVPIGKLAIANAIAIQPDGRIVLAGTADIGRYAGAAVRLNPNGALDRNFGARGVVALPQMSAVWGMVQTRGEFVLAGRVTDGSLGSFIAVRLRADGGLDRSFGAHGVIAITIGSDATALAVAGAPDGRLILSGDAALSDARTVATARVDPDGSLDARFGAVGIATFAKGFGVNGISLDPLGRILLAGGHASVARLDASGHLDARFGNGGVAAHPIGPADSSNGVEFLPQSHKLLLVGDADLGGHLVLSVMRVYG